MPRQGNLEVETGRSMETWGAADKVLFSESIVSNFDLISGTKLSRDLKHVDWYWS